MYRLTWEHPIKCGDVIIKTDWVEAFVYLTKHLPYPMKDVTEIVIGKVEENTEQVRTEDREAIKEG